MGLDVYAVTKYEVIENPTKDQKDELYGIYQPEDFTSHLGDKLKHGMVIDKKEVDGEYRSGYCQHGVFREFLASLVYKKVEAPKPGFSDPKFEDKLYMHRFPHTNGMYESGVKLEDDFVAIIHFSDCEGVIGNELCKALDASFDKHMNKASKSEWFDKYKDMAKCVKAAAKSGGYLDFH